MRLLADERGVAAHWRGGATPRARAVVDSLLDWYHASMRPHTLAWAYGAAIGRRLGKISSSESLDAAAAGTEEALAYIARRVAARDGVGDSRALTIADLAFACELSQFELLPAEGTHGAAAWQAMLARHDGLARYLTEVREACGRPWDDAHSVLYKLRERWAEADKKAVPLQ